LKLPIIKYLEVNIRTSYIYRIKITYKSFLKMPLSLNFYSSYNKGIIKNTWFYYSYNIRFNANSSFASKLEVPVAMCFIYSVDNISTNPSNIPTALKLINFVIAVINTRLLFINNYLAKSIIE
jgi:hypothetical protein